MNITASIIRHDPLTNGREILFRVTREVSKNLEPMLPITLRVAGQDNTYLNIRFAEQDETPLMELRKYEGECIRLICNFKDIAGSTVYPFVTPEFFLPGLFSIFWAQSDFTKVEELNISASEDLKDFLSLI